MISRSTHISPLVRIHRTRILAGNGHVLVQDGQKVKFNDVIARGSLPGNYSKIDIRKALGTSSKEKLMKAIQRRVGEVLQKGDIIAQTHGFASRILRANAPCRVISIENGSILLELDPAVLELKANYSGTIVEIIPDRGAVIEGDGALIQGVWGNGQSGGSILGAGLTKPDQEFTRASLDMSQRGSVWLSGFCIQEDALSAAAELSFRGLILSSMAASLIPVAEKLPFPVILLEGFGKISMNDIAFKLLSTNSKREVCIVAAQLQNSNEERPEIFLPLPTEANIITDVLDLEVGRRVRINMPPFSGKCGTVSNLKNEPVELPSQISAPCAEVIMENDQRMIVPVDNLEMIL
jgi:hypothetical protein